MRQILPEIGRLRQSRRRPNRWQNFFFVRHPTCIFHEQRQRIKRFLKVNNYSPSKSVFLRSNQNRPNSNLQIFFSLIARFRSYSEKLQTFLRILISCSCYFYDEREIRQESLEVDLMSNGHTLFFTNRKEVPVHIKTAG